MFQGKVVIVTGGSSGIGAAVAEQISRKNAIVIIVGRDDKKLKEVSSRLRENVMQNLPIKADISKDGEAKAVIEKTVEQFGKIDVLINNAGCLKGCTILDENVMEVYDDIMSTNLRAVVELTTLAVPYLIESKGCVVNVSSVISNRVRLGPEYVCYSVSKAGLDRLTKSIALELAPYGVRVNSVNPGPVKTEILRSRPLPEDFSWDVYSQLAPLGRIATSGQVAELVLFLASDEAKSVTGSCFTIDCGISLK